MSRFKWPGGVLLRKDAAGLFVVIDRAVTNTKTPRTLLVLVDLNNEGKYDVGVQDGSREKLRIFNWQRSNEFVARVFVNPFSANTS